MTAKDTIWKKDILGWSLYDFANTIYSMNIVSQYLKRYIVEDLGRPDYWFDIPFTISMVFAALLLPALGAMSDHSTRKKIFLFLFTLTCCTAAGLMAFVPPSLFILTIVLFIIANFAYEAGQPFYNALLYSVADGARARFISGFGVALGYVGSILGLILVLPFVSGDVFGWDVPFLDGSGKQGAFLPTAILFAVFSVPLFLWVREKPVKIQRPGAGFRAAYRDVWDGVRQTKKYPGVLRFLIADYFFEDAATTVILNIGLYCAVVLSLSDGDIAGFLIVSTVSAVIGSFVMGKIAQHWSLKKLLGLIIWGWVICLVIFVATNSMAVVWVLGSVIGILLGGLWTTSRPLLAELVPREELGRFFGLFSLSGRAAAAIGPLVWTAVVLLFNSERPMGRLVIDLMDIDPSDYDKLPYKVGVLSLALMMIVGLVIFRKVPSGGSASDG
ncbi:MAG: MFS transporter [candidate division Zixibacteria bacterium]|nr:MFS transporter [candidate division Zixibacteria bacterium]